MANRTYPNDNFAWYNDDNKLYIVERVTSSTDTVQTIDAYDSPQSSGDLSGTITDADCSGTTITFTTSAAHGLANGDRVSISGTTNFNDDNLASQSVTVTSTTEFTMTRSSSDSNTNETGSFVSLFIDNGLRYTYHSKYGDVAAQSTDLEGTSVGLDSGMHQYLLCYVKSRIFEDIGDLQKAQYFRQMFEVGIKQYPLRKSGVRTLAVPRI